MKIKLVFPAFWICNAPYLSVPSLAAYIQKYGYEVEQVDLNLEFVDRMLSKDFLELCMNRCLHPSQNKNGTSPYFDEVCQYIVNGIEEHKNMFRSKKALDLEVYENCQNFLAMGLAMINAAFPGEKIDHYYYESSYDRESFKSILKSADDAYCGKYQGLVGILTSYFIDGLVQNADLIGISLTGLDQIIPSFILAGLIKRKNPNIKVVLGGSVPTRWFADHKTAPNLFGYIDYVIVNEGEVPLVELIRYLNGEIPIEEVPQLVYLNENKKVTYTSLPITNIEMCELPTPIFNKADINRYLSPVPTLPLLSSRGCYWGKCTFCDHSFVYNNSFRPSNIDKTIEDISIYIREYGVNHINFHDEAMTPQGILTLSKRLLESGMNIKWSTDARLDKGLTYEILQKAYNAGLSVLFFGLESVNPRVLSLMKKGTHINVTQRVLADATRAGIAVHCFFICGFPTETLQEYQETLNFIKDNSNIIASHGCSIFSLGRHSPIAHEPDNYSLRITNYTDIDNASTDFEFERLDVNDTYESERQLIYEEATKRTFTYAQKAFGLFFREHWIIFWERIHEILLFMQSQITKQVLKSWVYLISGKENLLVFDSAKSELFVFDKSAEYAFKLIKEYGCASPEKLAKIISEHEHICLSEAMNIIEQFIHLLKEKELVLDASRVANNICNTPG